MTINTTNIIAAKGYGGADLVAIYQGGVKIWEAETEPAGPVAEWYGKSENYDFAGDHFNILPLASGDIYFKLYTGNEQYMLYNNTGEDSDEWNELPLTYVTDDSPYKKWSLHVNKLQPVYIKLAEGFKLYNGKNGGMDPQNTTEIYDATCDFYARGNLDKSWADAVTSSEKLVYKSLFRGNTHLLGTKYLTFFTQATGYSYEMYTCTWMFNNCTNLTTTPDILPALTISRGCYQEMYRGCVNITTAPKLPSLYSEQYTHQLMFDGCIRLNYIYMLSTYINNAYATNRWVQNVAATGIFVKNIDATWTTTGNDGVPENWTVIYYDDGKYYLDQNKSQECDDHGNPLAHNYANDPFTIVAKSDGDINIKIGNYYVQQEESESGSGSGDSESPSVVEVLYDLEYSTDGGTTWDIGYVMLGDVMTFTVQAGDEIMLRNDSVSVASNPNNFDLQNPIQISQSTTASFELQGNIMSLIYGEDFDGETSLTYGNHDFRFTQLFYNCTALTSAENLVMPATTLTSNCYNVMFGGCTALTKSPVLPATTLTNGCYSGMFGRCTSLSHITMLATDISAQNCLTNWVNGVAATGTFVKNASMNSLPSGASGIPSGWSVQDAT